MTYGMMFVGMPVLIYLATAAMPPGKVLAAAVGAVLLAAWAAYALSVPPLLTGENSRDGLTAAAAVILSVGFALGLLAQGFRWLLPERRPKWHYPAIVAGTAAAAGVPILSALGL